MRSTLLSFLEDFRRLQSREFFIHSEGYRTRRYSYGQFCGAVESFAARLVAAGLQPDDKVLFWGENRPEWLVAFWACVRQGVVVVPLDYRTSSDLLRRVHAIVKARLLLHGNEVGSVALDVPVWSFDSVSWLPGAAPCPAPVRADTTVEIVFTSGTTGDPKGVVIQHRNLLANIGTIEREINKYRRYVRLVSPLRFLNLLPLSHLFGQSLANFIPPLIGGTTVFTDSYRPDEIVRQIKAHRVSVLVSVPRILDLLADHIQRVVPVSMKARQDQRRSALARWWRYRRVHRLLGLKFWSFVVGAAPLDAASEQFWTRLGFLVIQGYGLTETAPVVSVNHPLRARSGSLGKPLAGVQVRLAPDGEILVRGEAVFSGYFESPGETARAFEDGWFHTGDIGAVDAEGRLYYRGRKKEMIVTAEGLNVFPEDVEAVLNRIAGVKESAVVALAQNGAERVHAVVVLEDPVADPRKILRQANSELQDFQRIRSISTWPEPHLPRTEGTQKLKRAQIRAILAGHSPQPHREASEGTVEGLLARMSNRAAGQIEENLLLEEDLGLGSLERVELLSTLEEKLGIAIDEDSFAQASRVADLKKLTEGPTEPGVRFDFPHWTRSAWARAVRWLVSSALVVPLVRHYGHLGVSGSEHLDGIDFPVLFAANHASHLDTPAILAALPPNWRRRIAPAMSWEYFLDYFRPRGFVSKWKTGILYYLACLFFNAFPLPQKQAGVRQTLQYMGEIVDAGYSPLVFPEGERRVSNEVGHFQPGIALMATRLQLRVVPIRLRGTGQILPPDAGWPRPGHIEVTLGEPLVLQGHNYQALARRVEDAVRSL